MSMTTVLPVAEDQCRTPVIFGSAASLLSATAASGAPSESGFPGLIKLSEAPRDRSISTGAAGVVPDRVEVAGFGATATIVAVGLGLEIADFPCICMPHHAPAENNAATANRASTTLNPGREL